ncbi:MAG: carotenoid oxygenase family protein [Anaerolineaceae bacterium]|nr:carotenoid oxygenase family protein [Anaerolineaceae bacterium]
MSKVYELGFGNTENEIKIEKLEIQGIIPGWLQGTLIRNGPGTFKVGEQQYRHWFDGLAMLHKFSIQNGNVSYANKYLNTKAYREAKATNQISYSEFATDPCRSLFSRIMTVFSPKITDSAKVSIAKIAQRYMALAETPIQVEFDPDTLESVGVFNYEDRLVGQMTTVHPQFDFEYDTVYNLVTRYHRVSHYNIHQIVGNTPPTKLSSLPVNSPSYLHSFGMSKNYFILTEFPLVVNPLALLLWLKPYIENFKWKPERGTPFWVINRHTGELVSRFESDPFFAFHHINAFEQGDELIVDLAAYSDASIIQSYYLQRMQSNLNQLPSGNLRRYRIPLKGKTVSYETISDSCMELPNFDYARLNTNPDYRYVYSVSVNKEKNLGFYNQILKVDIKHKKDLFWFEFGCYPGEPIFVGRPGRANEDDGVILSVVLDERAGSSFLLVLDASSFNEIARVSIPQPILFGYHGAYFPENHEKSELL